MPKSDYFKTHRNEADLVEDLTREAINAYGFNVVYIPREMVNPDSVLGEATISRFRKTHLIGAWCDNYNAWNGEGDFLSKFGIESNRGIDLIVSKKEFKVMVGIPANIPHARPGDLIYVDFLEKLFEIKAANDDDQGLPFYQFNKTFCYRLVTEQFVYAHEDMETGADVIDRIDANSKLRITRIGMTSGGTGEFYGGEFVSFGNTASAMVAHWNRNSNILDVYGVTGSMVAGLTLSGASSGAVWQIGTTGATTNNYITREGLGGYGENQTFQNENDSGGIIEFSAENPFSHGDV